MKHVAKGAGKVTSSVTRGVYFVVGVAMLALGIVGAFLPVMPTTIFIIAAAWCFGRSSPRFEAWLLDHPTFGPSLRAWREEGAISGKAKRMAWTGMAIGYGLFWLSKPDFVVAIGATLFIGAGAIYVGTRPEPGPVDGKGD